MRKIKVTDGISNLCGMEYVKRKLSLPLSDLNTKTDFRQDNLRVYLSVEVQNEYGDYIRSEIEDAVADVIAVNYKYNYFKKYIRSQGLTALENEILYSSLISADIEDDKRYIIRKIRNCEEYTIDGVYNFRLGALKKKWSEIVGYIPSVFDKNQLKEFVGYLVGEKRGKRAIVDGDSVYDDKYNKLFRTSLVGNYEDGKIVREVILSASANVEVISKIPEIDEMFIREFYGTKATFSNSDGGEVFRI